MLNSVIPPLQDCLLELLFQTLVLGHDFMETHDDATRCTLHARSPVDSIFDLRRPAPFVRDFRLLASWSSMEARSRLQSATKEREPPMRMARQSALIACSSWLTVAAPPINGCERVRAFCKSTVCLLRTG